MSKLNGAVAPPASSAAVVSGSSDVTAGSRSAADNSSWCASSKVSPLRRTGLCTDLARELLHDFFEFGVVAGQRQRALKVLERRGRVALAVEDLRQAADGRQVLRRLRDHELELEARVVELPEVQQRPPERDPGRQVAGVPGQPFAADPDRFLGLPRAPVLLRPVARRQSTPGRLRPGVADRRFARAPRLP